MKNKISFCTVCMNRLEHLRMTLPKNIEDNLSYPFVEFLIMDYSSSDGLSDWIKDEMAVYIDQGILSYYRYDDADYFNRSHSRNMMFKLASGDVICNVDADNYLGENFASYVMEVFKDQKDIFLIPDIKKRFYYIRDALGRFCAKKSDFMAISGYDEKMQGYGFEDNDLYGRLSDLGKEEVVIRDLKYLNTIQHTNEARVKNEYFTKYFEALYIAYQTPESSDLLILYKDGSFQKGNIAPNRQESPNPVVLTQFIWEMGTWQKLEASIIFEGASSSMEYQCKDQQDSLLWGKQVFYRMEDPSFLERIYYDLPLITNHGQMSYNRKFNIQTNQHGFGKGKVYKNFSNDQVNVL